MHIDLIPVCRGGSRTVLGTLFLLCVFLAKPVSSAEVSYKTVPVPNTAGEVVKSPQDSRDYRYIELSSGLKVLLISDPDTDKAAASVDVNVGSFHDPDDRLGLAHFLEHMLFLGNKKYPQVGEYSEFIKVNGGSSNAYTDEIHTNYFFDINAAQLAPAVDRLAQFFISPTLDKQYVDRERNAVDSEYKLHAKEDAWRLMQALSATSNPDFPGSRFSVGTLETLSTDGDDLWQDLNRFYRRHYVAGNMAVVIYGKEPLEQLETMARTSFSGVPSGPKTRTRFGVYPFTPEQKGVRINLIPLQDIRELTLTFPMPSVFYLRDRKPLAYLSRLIGYEGEGSLQSELLERGWIKSLSAGSDDYPGDFSLFEISLNLTPKGLENLDTITALIMDWVDLIRQNGVRRELFNETRAIADAQFRFQESMSPQSTVSSLSRRMHRLLPEELLNTHYVYKEFDKSLIEDLLSYVHPENMRMAVTAQGLETDKVEPFYKASYGVYPLPAELMKRLAEPERHAFLHIPPPNPFVPENFELVAGKEKAEPETLLKQPGMQLWHLQDKTFNIPKSNIVLMLSSPEAAATPEQAVLLHFYQALVNRELNRFGYPAREAGLGYQVDDDADGLIINVFGFSDKQDVLLDRIVDTLAAFRVNAKLLEQERQTLRDSLSNSTYDIPFRQLTRALWTALDSRRYSHRQLLDVIDKVTPARLQAFADQMMKHHFMEMFVHGNIDKSQARKLAKTLRDKLGKSRDERFQSDQRAVKAGVGHHLNLDIEHDDSGMLLYYQADSNSMQAKARLALLGQIISNPFYEQLRTDEQLGYAVWAGLAPSANYPGLLFVVQSPVADAEQLHQRAEKFIQDELAAVKAVQPEELARHKEGLVGEILSKDQNLSERTSRLWMVIADRKKTFNDNRELAAEVRKVTLAQLVETYKQLLLSDNPRRLLITSFGSAHRGKHYQAVSADNSVCTDSACIDVQLSP